MTIIEQATVLHYHRHRMSLYGQGTARALGWKHEASQQTRFDVLATVGDMTGCSLLDVGCGYGDLKAHLDRTHTGFAYIGIDQQPEFIAIARARHHDVPNTWFFQADFTTVAFPTVDYVMASGSLNYRRGDLQCHLGMIGKMFAAAARGVAFNMLDVARFSQHDLLVGHDLARIEAHCQSMTPHVRIIRGYLDDDFTIFMYKTQPGTGLIADEPTMHRTNETVGTTIGRDRR